MPDLPPSSSPARPLPPEVEERCYDIWFEEGGDDRVRALEALCAAHPAEAAAIRALALRLGHGDGVLGQLREEVEQAGAISRVGPYEVVEEIGRGGFGTVYRALQHEPVRRVVALKVLDAGAHQERAVARFALERQALARMQHPTIAQVYDAGTGPDRRPFIAMEFVDGGPITVHCDERRLDLDARLGLFVAVCDGVMHAHQRGIVHRDLKPSNVLVVERDGAPHPKIIDFGVAKALDDELGSAADVTFEGGFVGTPSYTSPEQAAGEAVDTRTDVYALGVLLSELLTGDLPFDRERLQSSSLTEALRIVREEEPRLPSRVLRSAPEHVAERRGTSIRRLRQRVRGDLDRIVLRALERDVDRRYASVEAFSGDVRRFLDDLPVSARRPTFGYVIHKLARRHRVLVAVAGVLLLAVLGTAAAVSWSLLEVRAARDAAVSAGRRASRNEYAAHIAAAKLALDKGDAAGARRTLAATDPRFRGWEHALLDSLCDDSLRSFASDQKFRCVEWTADDQLAALPYDGGVQIWSVDRGELLGGIDGQDGFLENVVRVGDGRRVITARRGRASRRDAETGVVHAIREVELVDLVDRRVVRKLAECLDGVNALAVSDDGEWFACSDATRTITRGRIDGSGEPERWPDFKLSVSALAFWPDGQSLVVGSIFGQVVRVGFDRRLADPEFCREPFDPHEGPVDVIRFDVERGILVTGDLQSRIVIWDLATGALRRVIPVPAEVREMLLDRERGVLYASGGYSEPMVAAWNLDTGEPLGTFDGHRLGVEGLALSPDGARLATSDRAGGIRVWSPLPRPDSARIELGYDCRSLSLAPDGGRVATCSMDGHVRVLETVRWEPVLDVELDLAWSQVALSERSLFAIAGDGVLRKFDVASGDVLGTVRVTAALTAARAMSTTAVGRLVAVTSDDRRLTVVDGETLQIAWERTLPKVSSALLFTPSEDGIVVAADDGRVELLAARTGDLRAVGVFGPTSAFGFAFSPAGDRLAVACGDGAVRLLDAADLREVAEMPAHSEAVFAVCFSPDGTRLATSGLDRTVRIFDVATATELLVLDSARTGVDDLWFLADGQRLIVRAHRWFQRTWLHVWDARPPSPDRR